MAEEIDDTSGDKPMVWLDDEGVAHYRASALGMCTTAFIAVRSGFEAMRPPKEMQDRFNEGHLHEPDIVRRANTEYGIEVFQRQSTIQVGITPTVMIEGHIDGIGKGLLPDEETHSWSEGIAPGPERLFEAKTMSEQAFKWWVEHDWAERWEKYPGYAMQLTTYGVGTGLGEALYAVKNKESGKVLIEATPTGVYPLSKIKAKVLGIEAHVRAGLPLPEDCDIRSFPCPVFYLGPCGEDRRDTIDDRRGEVMLALAQTYETQKAAEVNAKKAKETARDELKKHVPEGGKFDLPDGWKLSFHKAESKGVKEVESFDMERFIADHPDLYHEYLETTEVEQWSQERVVVTPPKQSKPKKGETPD